MSPNVVAIARFLAANREMEHLVASWRRELTAKRFDPDQPRVPKGSPDGGQWTKIGEAIELGGGRGRDRRLTPLRQLELQMLRAERDLAVQRARDIDPSWRPPGRVTDPNSVEGVIRGLRAEQADAEAFVRDATRPIWEITNPGGQPIGYRYGRAGGGIRTVDQATFDELVFRLRSGATELTGNAAASISTTYPGRIFRRLDGDTFGLRYSRNNALTIDIFNPALTNGERVSRIHFNDPRRSRTSFARGTRFHTYGTS